MQQREYTVLQDVVDAISIHFDPDMKTSVVKEDQQILDLYYDFSFEEDPDEEDLKARLHPWMLRLELNAVANAERA